MHIANGIVNAQVSAVFAVFAVVALALCVLRGRADLDDRLAPMAGLVAAFIFAVQMLNFQVLPGVSGHLLGGALAAILVGPWVGALCVVDRAVHPVPALRRRRPDRARAQHHQHGAARHGGRLPARRRPAAGAAEDAASGVGRDRLRRLGRQRGRRLAGLRAGVLAGRHHASCPLAADLRARWPACTRSSASARA